MKLLPFLLLSVASVLPVRCPAQVVVQPPGIRVVLAGPGITVNTNGFTRTISAPGAAGDITGGAVTGGLLTVGEAGGVLTFGLSTNAVRSAVAGIYLPMSGGTMTGAINMGQANITYAGALGLYDGSSMPNTGEISLEGNIPTWTFSGNSHTIWHSGNDGSVSQLDADLLDGQNGTYYTDPDNLAGGTVPDSVIAAKYRQPVISWGWRDLDLYSASGLGWTSYFIDTGTSPNKRTLGMDAVTAAAATDQTGTFYSELVPVPAAFTAFKEIGCIRVTWVSSQAIVGESEIRGIRIIGSSDLGVTANMVDLYTDTTARDIATTAVPVTISIDRASMASTTVPNYIQVQIDVSCEDGDKIAIIRAEVRSE